MEHPELRQQPRWMQTGDACFPVAAKVGSSWWVLRVNNFPDHPLWTLLVDGRRRFDLDDVPPPWGRPADPSLPSMAADDAEQVLEPVKAFIAYGSEVGQPCDNPFCCG